MKESAEFGGNSLKAQWKKSDILATFRKTFHSIRKIIGHEVTDLMFFLSLIDVVRRV